MLKHIIKSLYLNYFRFKDLKVVIFVEGINPTINKNILKAEISGRDAAYWRDRSISRKIYSTQIGVQEYIEHLKNPQDPNYNLTRWRKETK